MPPFRPALAAACLMALSAPALAEEAAPYGQARGWAVQSVSQDGQFLRCSAQSPGGGLALEFSAEGWWLTVPALPGQGDERSDETPGIVDVDRASFEVTFYASASGRFGAPMEEGMVATTRAGRTLVVNVNDETTLHPLTGSAAAMLKVSECFGRGGTP